MTEFTKKVYDVVRRIPKGKTMTYAQVARAIGNPLAVRAVGNALNKNRSKDVPCHRVIRTDGSVGGYNRGANRKLLLLKNEGALVMTKS